MIKVNIDLDNVVYPWSAAMAYQCETVGTEAKLSLSEQDLHEWDGIVSMYPSPKSWAFWTPEWGVPHGLFMRLWREGVDSGSVFGGWFPPLPGAVDALWAMSEADVYIRLVTTRLSLKHNHRAVVTNTAEWLDRYHVPYRSLAFLGPQETKADFKADFALDDNEDNTLEMREAGIDAYLLARDSNESNEYLLPRVTWPEFKAIVLEAA